jgi:hypothetical protein
MTIKFTEEKLKEQFQTQSGLDAMKLLAAHKTYKQDKLPDFNKWMDDGRDTVLIQWAMRSGEDPNFALVRAIIKVFNIEKYARYNILNKIGAQTSLNINKRELDELLSTRGINFILD